MPLKLRSVAVNLIYRFNPIVLFLLRRKKMSLSGALAIYRKVMKGKAIDLVRRTDTLAVMGSGSSINELGADDIDFLKTIDVLAINHFAYHEQIIPDFYMYEGITDVPFHLEAIRLLNLRADAYKNVIYLFKSFPWFKRHGSLAEQFAMLDEKILGRIKLFKTDFSAEANVADDVSPALFKVKDILGPHPQLKGSLTAALSWAYNMGYKKIILYGVDLGGPYFWESADEVKPTAHFTALKAKKKAGLTADKLLPLIRERIFLKAGKDVFVASKTSKLYPSIPLFDFKK